MRRVPDWTAALVLTVPTGLAPRAHAEGFSSRIIRILIGPSADVITRNMSRRRWPDDDED
jgi:hypothetical protein